MSNRLILPALLVLTLPLMALSCPEADRTATSIVLPAGDPEAGRRDFVSLGCALCHAAAGDRGIPEFAASEPGPVIGPDQAGKSTAVLVQAILNPSHRPPDSQANQVPSPMPDYNEVTVRQLSDVIAYIRYLGD